VFIVFQRYCDNLYIDFGDEIPYDVQKTDPTQISNSTTPIEDIDCCPFDLKQVEDPYRSIINVSVSCILGGLSLAFLFPLL